MLFAPNFTQEVQWTPSDIQSLLQTLGYPYQVRSDAITAVGAPSSIGYLVKALYWLYQIARQFYQSGVIMEEASSEHTQFEQPLSIFTDLIKD